MKKLEQFRFVSDNGLRSLVEGLMEGRKVIGTVSKDGFPAFARINRYEDLCLSQSPTHLSAKEFLFPQRETLLRFNIEKKTHEQVIEAEDQAIIGLHPCDIHAIALMDRVFAYGTKDPNYLARRDRTILVGTDCVPDRYCLCKSLGTSEADDVGGYDIFLHSVGKGYLARAGSVAGARLLSRHAPGRRPTGAQIRRYEERRKTRDASFTASLDEAREELAAIYAASDESPVWERIGAICYGCGSCNNVCPTCYCFDVKDEVRANLKEGERVRTWDGCTLEDFAKVAGGHNFRRTRAERLRHRFNRKFRYLSGVFGSHFCVGCGRCSRTCLVGINITEVTNELIREARCRK